MTNFADQMKKRDNHILLRVFLFMLFLSYQAGISLFSHSHNVGGVTIVHSHPYASSTHSHSTGQLYTISVADNLVFDSTEEINISNPLQSIIATIEFCLPDMWVNTVNSSIYLRAPPYFSHIF